MLYYIYLAWGIVMKILTLPSVIPYASNTYFLVSGSEGCVIDPSTPYDDSVLPCATKYILLTHSHFDHILTINDWVESTGARVCIFNSELSFLSDPEKNCYSIFFAKQDGYFGEATPLYDDDVIQLGDEFLRVIHTPGHTCGSSVFVTEKIALVGDTVFAGGGYGRWDLPSGDYTSLRNSITKIASLPDDTVLYPGHGDPTTVRDYKRDYFGKRV